MAIAILKYTKMKKIFVYMSIIVLLASCASEDVEYPDFTYQTIYFPVQNPIRTVVLGDEIRFDSSIDLEKAFSIGVNVGGLYENTKERKVSIKLAPELVPTDPTKLLITNTTPADTLVILPPSYYKASSLTEMVIPAGSLVGKIRIDLTDAFFNDPKSVNLKYVLPLIINPDPASKDSVLQGKPAVLNPSRTKRSDWLGGLTPKDYTLFAVNYTNRFHGVYFVYGLEQIFNSAGVLVTSKPYNTRPVIENNATTTLTTLSLSECLLSRLGSNVNNVLFQMKLKYNPDKTITLSSVKGGNVVTGTGKYKEAADGVVWGQKPHKTVMLDYSYKDAAGEHRCKDTLVYRSSGIVYKEFTLK
jgi:hypothetical protein